MATKEEKIKAIKCITSGAAINNTELAKVLRECEKEKLVYIIDKDTKTPKPGCPLPPIDFHRAILYAFPTERGRAFIGVVAKSKPMKTLKQNMVRILEKMEPFECQLANYRCEAALHHAPYLVGDVVLVPDHAHIHLGKKAVINSVYLDIRMPFGDKSKIVFVWRIKGVVLKKDRTPSIYSVDWTEPA